MADDFNKPNLVVPLAFSYDTRGLGARTAMEAGKDQRKINCYYDVIRNSVTGQTTLELCKRPGVKSADSATLIGGSGTLYLLMNPNGGLSSSCGIFWDGTDIKAYDESTSGTILSSSTFGPGWCDFTTISGTKTMVVQTYHNTASAQRVFYATAVNSWTEISDSTFTGLTHLGKMEFMDGYAFIMDSRCRIYNSDLNSLSAWGDTSFITKDIRPDTAVGLARFKNMILAFGSRSVEVFRNVGNPSGSPLSTIKELAADVGMGYNALILGSGQNFKAYNSYYAVVGERLYFVGGTAFSAGNGILMSFDGARFEAVSNGPMNKIISENSVVSVHKVHMRGRLAVGLSFSSSPAGDQKGIIYFPDVNEYFEWTSSVFSLINDGNCYGNTASSSGTLYNIARADGAPSSFTDDGTAFTATVQFRLPTDSNNRKFMRWCALEADTTTSASNVTVKFSDDDYQNFDAGRTIDLNTAEKRLMRCGSYKNRVVRLEHSANAEFRARKFLARVE